MCRFVKGVFNERPPPVRVVPTWDIGKVLQCVSQWHPASDISLRKLTWKVVFLLATCTAKRVSDLILFSVDQRLRHVGNSSTLLQRAFGSKTDCPSRRAPPVRLKQCAEQSLCPVSYFRKYIRRTDDLRQDTSQLFISPVRPHWAVKLATLGLCMGSASATGGRLRGFGRVHAHACNSHELVTQRRTASTDNECGGLVTPGHTSQTLLTRVTGGDLTRGGTETDPGRASGDLATRFGFVYILALTRPGSLRMAALCSLWAYHVVRTLSRLDGCMVRSFPHALFYECSDRCIHACT